MSSPECLAFQSTPCGEVAGFSPALVLASCYWPRSACEGVTNCNPDWLMQFSSPPRSDSCLSELALQFELAVAVPSHTSSLQSHLHVCNSRLRDAVHMLETIGTRWAEKIMVTDLVLIMSRLQPNALLTTSHPLGKLFRSLIRYRNTRLQSASPHCLRPSERLLLELCCLGLPQKSRMRKSIARACTCTSEM